MRNKSLVAVFKHLTERGTQGLWALDDATLSPGTHRMVTLVRWLLLVFEGFRRDKLMLRSSALTFTTILSIVPFLAVAFSVLKGFGFQNTDFIRDILLRASAGREQVVEHIIGYINNTNVKTLGGLGVGLLLFTVISLLSNIESSFNTIWGVERGRTFGRKTTDYFSVSLIFPVLIVTAISFTATLQSNTIIQQLLTYSVFSEIYLLFFKLIPYVSVWLALTFLYAFIPNTKVHILPALCGGVIAGTVWQVAQWAYISFQVGAAKYNAIYGSFAQLPLFLVWVYMSWVIVLLGAEMSFALQNFGTFEKQAKYRHVSEGQKRRFGLALLISLARTFLGRHTPPTQEELAQHLGLPQILVGDLLFVLAEAGLVGKLETEQGDSRWSLIAPPDAVRIGTVLDWFDRVNASDTAQDEAVFATAAQALEALRQGFETSDANATLASLAETEKT